MVSKRSLLCCLAVAAGPIGLVEASAQSITGGDDSVAIASEVRAFLRDRAAGNVPALVDHIWPAKIKPSSREDRQGVLTQLAATLRERVAVRLESPDCDANVDRIVIAIQGEWAVVAVQPCRADYAAPGETERTAPPVLVPLQRVAGRWKVSGSMP